MNKPISSCAGVKKKFARLINRALPKNRGVWKIGYYPSDWPATLLSLDKLKVVQAPRGHYFADPFVARCNGATAIFFEDFDINCRVGSISAAILDKENEVAEIRTALKEPFHLSFPFVFAYEGHLYMVPESAGVWQIRIYRCVKFPFEWEFLFPLIDNINGADTVLFERSGRWWLLTSCIDPNRSRGMRCFRPHLHAFYADAPTSRNWQPHPENPIVSDVAFGRNGGLLFDGNQNAYRVRQGHTNRVYGFNFSIARIDQLTTEAYQESLYCNVLPDFLPGLSGTHHMHSDSEITAVDFKVDRLTFRQ